MARFRTHYDNLKVSRNAPAIIIKAAYKKLSQNYHPDKFPGDQGQAHQIMKAINKAYVVLSDPIKRAAHDRWIEKNEREFLSKSEKTLKNSSIDREHDSVGHRKIGNLKNKVIHKNTIGDFYASQHGQDERPESNNSWFA